MSRDLADERNTLEVVSHLWVFVVTIGSIEKCSVFSRLAQEESTARRVSSLRNFN